MSDDAPARKRRFAPEPGEPHRPWHGYGLVFVLVGASFAFSSAAPNAPWATFTRALLLSATLLVTLEVTGEDRRIRHIARFVVPIALLGSAIALFGPADLGRLSTLLVTLLVVLGTPLAILRDVGRHPEINGQTVLAALSFYLLIGIFFSVVYGTVDIIQDGKFFTQVTDPKPSDFQYFSFVTLTTTGYGDLTARSPIGHTLAVIEALMGQLYLVTVVALLVSRFGMRRQQPGPLERRREAREAREEHPPADEEPNA